MITTKFILGDLRRGAVGDAAIKLRNQVGMEHPLMAEFNELFKIWAAVNSWGYLMGCQHSGESYLYRGRMMLEHKRQAQKRWKLYFQNKLIELVKEFE